MIKWTLADLPRLESGDIFATSIKGQGIFGWLAPRIFKPYTDRFHFGLIWYQVGGDWVILESIDKGIAVGRLSFYCGEDVAFYRANCSEQIRYNVCGEMTKYGRSPYDYKLAAKLVLFGLIKWASVGFRKLTADELPYSADTQFACIEVVDMGYWLSGYAIIPETRMPIPSAMKQAEVEGHIVLLGYVNPEYSNERV